MQKIKPFCNIYMWSVSLKRHLRSEDTLLKQPFLTALTLHRQVKACMSRCITEHLYWMCYMGVVVFLSKENKMPWQFRTESLVSIVGLRLLGIFFVIASRIGVLEWNSCQALWLCYLVFCSSVPKQNELPCCLLQLWLIWNAIDRQWLSVNHTNSASHIHCIGESTQNWFQ